MAGEGVAVVYQLQLSTVHQQEIVRLVDLLVVLLKDDEEVVIVLDVIVGSDRDDGLVEEYCHWGVVGSEAEKMEEVELEFVTCPLDLGCFWKKLKHQSGFLMVDICDLAATIHCKVMELLEL